MLNGEREEDRRIYERSARLLFLAALRDTAPEARVRFEHSLGRGVYMTLSGVSLGASLLEKTEARMRELSAANLPISRRRMTREFAMNLFRQEGREDTVRLLGYRTQAEVDVYECEGYQEYAYGAMAASTGEITSYALRMYYPGAVLLLPYRDLTGAPDVLCDRPALVRTYREANRIQQIDGCSNAADLNEIIARGEMRTLIRVNEAQHSRAVARIAENIRERGARIVFVAGPSSSGKTTFAHRLSVELRASGLRPVAVSLDNYYRNREDVPLGADGKPDLECLEAIDVPLFSDQLIRLLDGQTVEIPRYSFKTKMREEKGDLMSIGPEDVLVVEGIHGLNPALSENIPGGYKYRVYVSSLTPLNLDEHNRIRATDARLLRRMVRDHRTRGSSVAETMEMWDSVRAGEEKYIFPYQEEADVMFNTSLAYELPILKKYAYELLCSVPEESPDYTRARRLVRFLNYFLDSGDESEIPPTSILREFIGGCSFYGE